MAGNPLVKFVGLKKQQDDRHLFGYQCKATGHMVEVEQRYNEYSKAEEVRFLVNKEYGEWITKGISPDLYRYFMERACAESTTQTLSFATIPKY